MINRLNSKQKIGLLAGVGIIILLTVFHNPFGGYTTVEPVLYTKDQFIREVRQSLERRGVREYDILSDEDLYNRLITRYPGLKTWIYGESRSREVATVYGPRGERNLGFSPPAGYWDKPKGIYSNNALFKWINRPSEYIGFSVPILVFILFWLYLFNKNKP